MDVTSLSHLLHKKKTALNDLLGEVQIRLEVVEKDQHFILLSKRQERDQPH